MNFLFFLNRLYRRKKKQATNLSDFFSFSDKKIQKMDFSQRNSYWPENVVVFFFVRCRIWFWHKSSYSLSLSRSRSLSLSRSRSRSYKTQCLRISKAKIKSPEISNRLKMTTAETSFKNRKKNKEGEVSGCRVTKTELRRLFVLEYKLWRRARDETRASLGIYTRRKEKVLTALS